jgi:hypothetical protein
VATALQIVIAVAIGLAILGAGLWAVRLLASPVPREPDPEDLVEVAIGYRCTVCGMQLTITQAQGEEIRAPRHCREEMEPL